MTGLIRLFLHDIYLPFAVTDMVLETFPARINFAAKNNFSSLRNSCLLIVTWSLAFLQIALKTTTRHDA